MHRLTFRFALAATTFAVLLVPAVVVLAPASAHAAGCEVLDDPGDRTECRARAAARDAARDEVQRQLRGGSPASSRGGAADASGASGPARSADWQAAVDEANGFDPGALLDPRPLAAIGGLVWFLVAVRSRRRANTRSSRA